VSSLESGDEHYTRDIVLLFAMGRCSLNYMLPNELLRPIAAEKFEEQLEEPSPDHRFSQTLNALTDDLALGQAARMISAAIGPIDSDDRHVNDLVVDEWDEILRDLAPRLD
jgi:hypothetical protein